MRRQAKKFAKGSPSDGSALILTVVLTSLLAMVGVLFVMMARVNQITTSAISEAKELNAAVETVIAKISEELVLDVPGVSATNPDYYDYPDVNNAWLASLEPYDADPNPLVVDPCWRQISDVTGFLNDKGFPTQNVNVRPVGLSTTVYVREYPVITLDDNGELKEQSADADGDGIADSKWIQLDDITSSKGKPIYAAIRIVDNGGMLNVNTAYMFDPNDPTVTAADIDGSSQLQINLMALAGRPPLPTWPVGNPHTLSDEIDLRTARANGVDVDPYLQYQNSVIWSYGEPAPYTPFDVSDELELRYRFLLNHPGIDTRLEDWGGEFRGTVIETPVDSGGLDKWFKRASFNPAILDPSIDSKDPNYYAYRHIATTYNMDRIIDPSGNKMLNINTVSAADYNTIKEAFTDSNFADANGVAAQITANLIDYVDGLDYPTSDSRYDPDNNITVVYDDANIPYYGFERPCIYISELAHRFSPNPLDPTMVYRSYAIELYKPYFEDNDPNGWQIVIDGALPITIGNWTGGEQFYVVRDQNSDAQLDVDLGATVQNATFAFTANTEIRLERPLPGGSYITVDWYKVDPCIPAPWLLEDNVPHSVHRDIQPHKCIRRLWDSSAQPSTLGRDANSYSGGGEPIQAHPANEDFTNIGEIGIVFRKGAYGTNGIGYNTDNDEEKEVRIDLADPNFQQIFNYLTVFDPAVYSWNDPNEARIKGRININTAPWFVLAQLPWVSQREGSYNNTALAEAIVGNRDIAGAFENIGQLMRVTDANADRSIDYYLGDDSDIAGFPDLTGGDGAIDDFEERDLIFARISNLVTVRSDVFTAYILVRIGTDGPQKRVIAIFDRSDVYSSDDGGIKVRAVQPVADPR